MVCKSYNMSFRQETLNCWCLGITFDWVRVKFFLIYIFALFLFRDTAGQERFRTLTSMHFRGTKVSCSVVQQLVTLIPCPQVSRLACRAKKKAQGGLRRKKWQDGWLTMLFWAQIEKNLFIKISIFLFFFSGLEEIVSQNRFVAKLMNSSMSIVVFSRVFYWFMTLQTLTHSISFNTGWRQWIRYSMIYLICNMLVLQEQKYHWQANIT